MEGSPGMGSNRRTHFFQIYTFLISNRLEIPKPHLRLKHLKSVNLKISMYLDGFKWECLESKLDKGWCWIVLGRRLASFCKGSLHRNG